MTERKKTLPRCGRHRCDGLWAYQRSRRQQATDHGSQRAEADNFPPDAHAFLGDLVAKAPFRDRATVARDISGHIAARRAYQQGVAWLVAAEDQNLLSANIEAAQEDLRTFYEEMVEAVRRLVIVMPTDLKALCDLTMYLETSYTSLLEEVLRSTGNRSATPRVESLAFHLVRTMRLSLRHVPKYGKHEPTS